MACSSTAHAASLLDLPLRDLLQGGTRTLGEHQSAVVAMLFAPDCRYCHFQVKHLNQWRFNQSETDLAVVGLGVNGQLLALKKEAFSLKASFPLLMGSPAFTRQLGKVPATPILVLLSREGHLMDFRRGVQSLEALEHWLNGRQRY